MVGRRLLIEKVGDNGVVDRFRYSGDGTHCGGGPLFRVILPKMRFTIRLWQAIGERPVDLVISDMAPNMSGMASAIDQPKAMYLVELGIGYGDVVP